MLLNFRYNHKITVNTDKTMQLQTYFHWYTSNKQYPDMNLNIVNNTVDTVYCTMHSCEEERKIFLIFVAESCLPLINYYAMYEKYILLLFQLTVLWYGLSSSLIYENIPIIGNNYLQVAV